MKILFVIALMVHLTLSVTPQPTGIITGNMFYKDIEVAELFEKPFVDVLGDPLSERGHFFLYDDLEIVAEWNNLSSSYEMAQSVHISNLSVFSINGITLDKTRAELLAIFGEHIFYSYPDFKYYNRDDPNDYRWLGYHISLNDVTHRLDFYFNHADYNAHSLSIRRFDL